MVYDKRQLHVDVVDQDPWWVLAAVESAVIDAAAKHGITPDPSLRVEHAGGIYFRDSVEAAKATASTNGWLPTAVWMQIDRQREGDDIFPNSWVKADFSASAMQACVSVEGGIEIEVNGVFAIVELAVLELVRQREEEAAEAERQREAEAGEAVRRREAADRTTALAAAVEPAKGWRRLWEHSWTVAIGAGLVVAGLLAGFGVIKGLF